MMAKSKKTGEVIEHVGRNSTVVRFDDVRRGWEKWILLRSDVHHDNPKCDQALELRHLKQALEKDAFIVDNGDLFCAMQGKWDKRSDKNALRPEHLGGNYLDLLVDTAFNFYKPFAKNWLLFGRGNHETAIRKSHETDLTDRLVDRMRLVGSPALAGGYGGYIRFHFTLQGSKRTSRLLYHYHGSGGGGPVTRGVIQTNRIAVVQPDADICLTGHTHDEWIVPIIRQRVSNQGVVYRDRQIHIRVPGYKDAWADGAFGYEVERMHMPKPLGAAWLRFYYEQDEIKTQAFAAE
jgi:hypothetical protein